MKRKLIVFESLERLVSDAWRFRPNHCKCKTIIRNGLISRYDTPSEIIELRWNPMDTRGMKPDEIETVGTLKPPMLKRVREMRCLYKDRKQKVG